MAANRNHLMPQLQECERIVLPSVTIPRVALDHGLHAEGTHPDGFPMTLSE